MIDLDRPRLVNFRNELVSEIPCQPESARPDLQVMALPSILLHYLNWRDRFVMPRPRRIRIWDGFYRTLDLSKHLAPVSKIQRHIEAGDDLTPFLSERVRSFGYVQPNVEQGKKRRHDRWSDKDFALNVHEVHHLHLGLKKRADGIARRTDDLLFVQFGRDVAGLLMVGNHKSFDDGTLADAIAQIRAEGGQTLKGVTGETLPPKERTRLQRRGYLTVVQVGERVVHGGFYSCSGHYLFHQRYADQIMRCIEANESQVDDSTYIRKLFDAAGRPMPDQSRFAWSFQHCDVGLFEEVTRTFFCMLQWMR